MIPTYKDILTCKVWLGDIAKMYEFATQLGYSHFMWNDRVYRIVGGFSKDVVDTGLTVHDIR